MKKILALVAALFLGMVALAGPAAATGNDTPDADNKKVDLCHYAGSDTNGGSGNYVRNEVSVSSFLNSGHNDHVNDAWETFTYTTKGGELVTVAGQNQHLLAFENCEQPVVDDELAVPAVNKVDKCGTDDDTVTPVRDDAKYTTEVGERVGDSVTVTFTAKDGFTFASGKVATVTVNFPNNDDCDLPETGGGAVYNTALGGAALAGVILLALAMLFTRKRA